MKKIKKIILVILGVVFSASINVLAQEIPSPKVPSNVRLVGTDTNELVFIPGDEPFLLGNNMLPGDKISRTMVIENRNTVPFSVYLRAVRFTPIPEDGYDLLKKLNLKIRYMDKVLYDGPISEEDGKLKNISLGKYEVNNTQVLDAEVYFVPGEDDNYYKNKSETVEWIFTIVSDDNPNGKDPAEKINDLGKTISNGISEIPHISSSGYSYSSPEKGEYIKTGDDSGLYVITGILVISGASLILMLKRRKNDEN